MTPYTLARIARLAYKSRRELSYHDIRGEFGNVFYASHDNTQATILVSETDLVIAFRGTDEIKDWMTNLDTHVIDHQHQGFLMSAASIWPQISLGVRSMRNKRQSVWLTGHSLGGALALITAKWMDVPVAGVYTFGQPRTVTRGYVPGDYPIYRFVNNNDIVPRVPSPLRGYRHVGKLLYFNSSGHPVTGRLCWLARLADMLGGVISDIGKPGLDIAKDHNILDYMTLIKINSDFLRSVYNPKYHVIS